MNGTSHRSAGATRHDGISLPAESAVANASDEEQEGMLASVCNKVSEWVAGIRDSIARAASAVLDKLVELVAGAAAWVYRIAEIVGEAALELAKKTYAVLRDLCRRIIRRAEQLESAKEASSTPASRN